MDKFWLPRLISAIFIAFSLGLDFLELVASPLCLIRVTFWSILTNSCWLKLGCGFFNLGGGPFFSAQGVQGGGGVAIFAGFWPKFAILGFWA